MQAAVYKGPGLPWVVENVADPVPLAGEAVIRVGRCGICGSDLKLSSEGSQMPCDSILGHEYSGEIVALAPGETWLRIGDNVTALPATGCGECAQCQRGEPVLCAQLRAYMGGFAEFMRIPQAGTIRLPEALSLADGALVEPLAVGLHGVRLSTIADAKRIVILGVGSVGLATLYWANQLGTGKIVAASRSDRRQSLALAMGANHFVTTGDDDAARIADALGGPPDLVFECAGSPGTIAQSLNLVRTDGTVVVLGSCMKPEQIVSVLATMKQARMVFASAYSMEEFRFVVDHLGKGHFDPRKIVSKTIGLDALPAMIEAMRAGTSDTKVHVDPAIH